MANTGFARIGGAEITMVSANAIRKCSANRLAQRVQRRTIGEIVLSLAMMVKTIFKTITWPDPSGSRTRGFH